MTTKTKSKKSTHSGKSTRATDAKGLSSRKAGATAASNLAALAQRARVEQAKARVVESTMAPDDDGAVRARRAAEAKGSSGRDAGSRDAKMRGGRSATTGAAKGEAASGRAVLAKKGGAALGDGTALARSVKDGTTKRGAGKGSSFTRADAEGARAHGRRSGRDVDEPNDDAELDAETSDETSDDTAEFDDGEGDGAEGGDFDGEEDRSGQTARRRRGE